MCHDKNIKGGSKRIEPHRQIKVSCYQQKKDYFIYVFFFFVNYIVATKQKSRAETQNKTWWGGEEMNKSLWKTRNLIRQMEKEGKRNIGDTIQPEGRR